MPAKPDAMERLSTNTVRASATLITGTIGYEIVCGLSRRLPRSVIG